MNFLSEFPLLIRNDELLVLETSLDNSLIFNNCPASMKSEVRLLRFIRSVIDTLNFREIAQWVSPLRIIYSS